MTPSRLELESTIAALIRPFDMRDVREMLVRFYRRSKFKDLTIEQLQDFINKAKESNSGTLSVPAESNR